MVAEKESSAAIAQQTQQRHEQGVLELQVSLATVIVCSLTSRSNSHAHQRRSLHSKHACDFFALYPTVMQNR